MTLDVAKHTYYTNRYMCQEPTAHDYFFVIYCTHMVRKSK